MGDITATTQQMTAQALIATGMHLLYMQWRTTVTLHTDETEGSSVKVATTIDGLSVTARYEVDGKAAGDSSETELSLGYTMGDVALSLAYDTGKKGHLVTKHKLLCQRHTQLVALQLQQKQTTKANTKFQQVYILSLDHIQIRERFI